MSISGSLIVLGHRGTRPAMCGATQESDATLSVYFRSSGEQRTLNWSLCPGIDQGKIDHTDQGKDDTQERLRSRHEGHYGSAKEDHS